MRPGKRETMLPEPMQSEQVLQGQMQPERMTPGPVHRARIRTERGLRA